MEFKYIIYSITAIIIKEQYFMQILFDSRKLLSILFIEGRKMIEMLNYTFSLTLIQ